MAKTLLATTGSFTVSTGATSYIPLYQGRQTTGTTESNLQVTYRTAGVFSNLYVRVITNGTSATSSVITRKGAADGAQSVSIGSAATGEFTDATNTDTVSAADNWNYKIVNGGGGNLIITTVGVNFAATTNTVTKFGAAGGSWSTASTSFYETLSGTLVDGATEAEVQTKVKTAGTFKNFFCSVFSNARTTTTTYKSRKNGADGNLSISIGSTATGKFEDTSNSDTVAVDDLYCTVATTGTGTGNLFPNHVGISFETTNDTHHLICGSNVSGGAGTQVNISVTTYFPVCGHLVASTTENDQKLQSKFAFTLSKLACRVVTNGITATSTFRLRVNGGNGNQLLSITTGATGYFEDTSNTDSIGATDLINFSIVTGGSGTNIKIGHTSMLATVASASSTVPIGIINNPISM